MITLRPAEVGEWLAIANITKLANEQYAPAMGEEHWHHYDQSTRSMLLTETGVRRFVATLNGEIVGSVVYCPPYNIEMGGKVVNNPYPEFRLLSVVPQCRNMGIAKALIEACEDEAKRENAQAISLHTTALMQVAKAMYERRGYERFSEIDFELGQGILVMGYKKNLAN